VTRTTPARTRRLWWRQSRDAENQESMLRPWSLRGDGAEHVDLGGSAADRAAARTPEVIAAAATRVSWPAGRVVGGWSAVSSWLACLGADGGGRGRRRDPSRLEL